MGQDTFKELLEKDWYNQTTLHPLAVVAVSVLGLALMLLPRRYATWPMLAMACLVAPAQRLVIAGFDFDMLRLMVLFGWARIILRGEVFGVRWKLCDMVVLAWVVSGTIAYATLWGTTQALVNRLGWAYDVVGMYFLFRALVRDMDDIFSMATGAALLAVPVAAAFLVERATGRNLFAVFGGVREMTMLRGGRLRCQGAFAHPILAGTFWATLMPLMGALWLRAGAGRTLALAGCLAAGVIVVTCASSGPVLTVATVLLGAALFRWRHHTRLMRWALVALLIGLHLVMNKPVWHLIARIDLVGGSTGWHRYLLIDRAIANFSEWAANGTRATDHWGPGLRDVTNEFVLQGVRGGALTLALFVLLIALSFRAVGRLWRRCAARDQRAMAWALGVGLFAHVVSFIGVSYFGQIQVVWFMLLAAIASLAAARAWRPGPVPAPLPLPARPLELGAA